MAGAETATATAVQSALHELPNYVVDDCSVTCTYAYAVGVSALYPSVACDIEFTGGSVAGPQYLLEVEADKCDSGCTPQLSSPVQLKSAIVPSTAASSFVQTDTTINFRDLDHCRGQLGAAGTTTINLAAGGGNVLGDGSAPPATPFYILIDNEVIKVTTVATDALTVVRGQAGTTDAAHADGATVTVLTHGVRATARTRTSSRASRRRSRPTTTSFECGRRGKCDYSSGECVPRLHGRPLPDADGPHLSRPRPSGRSRNSPGHSSSRAVGRGTRPLLPHARIRAPCKTRTRSALGFSAFRQPQTRAAPRPSARHSFGPRARAGLPPPHRRHGRRPRPRRPRRTAGTAAPPSRARPPSRAPPSRPRAPPGAARPPAATRTQ